MGTIGIVAISVLAALFLFALLAAVGVLIWLAESIKRQLSESKQQNASVHAETARVLAAHQTESKGQLDSAKAAFAGIRTEVRTLLESQQKELGATLDEHRRQMNLGIEKINADALTSVAARLTQVCIRTEKAISVLQELILNTEKAPGGEYGAEEFAPEEAAFGTPPSGFAVNRTAQLDAQADAEQNREVFSENTVEA